MKPFRSAETTTCFSPEDLSVLKNVHDALFEELRGGKSAIDVAYLNEVVARSVLQAAAEGFSDFSSLRTASLAIITGESGQVLRADGSTE